MKRYTNALACTLVLSLLIAFGFSQNSISLAKVLGTEKSTTAVDESVVNNINEKSLTSDDQTKTVVTTVEDTDTDSKEVTPDMPALIQASTKNTTMDKTLQVKTTAKKTTATKTTKNTTKKNKTKKTTVSKAVKNSSKKISDLLNAQNVYKNVDLSQCDTVKEVVVKLQSCGYTNINMNNVKNIKALKDILANLQGNSGSTTTPTPTKAPVVTQKPAPTKTPDVTTTPTPTKAPVVTAKPTPTSTPAPTTKPADTSSNTGMSSYAKEVLRLVNIEREKAGLNPFTTNSTLTAAANKRAQEIVQSFSHTRPNGTGFQTVLGEYGVSYRTAGENIAYGQKSAQEVVTGWMNSPGHRANILNANFNKLGVGVYQKNGTIYWTQAFTN